jgi:hypothetical protein
LPWAAISLQIVQSEQCPALTVGLQCLKDLCQSTPIALLPKKQLIHLDVLASRAEMSCGMAIPWYPPGDSKTKHSRNTSGATNASWQ